MKLKRSVKIIISLLIIAFCSYKFLIPMISKENQIFDKIENKKESVKQEKEEKWPKISKLSFLATGDGLIHNALALYAKQNDGTYDFSSYLTEVKDIVSSYDLAYYNQETVFGGKDIGYSYYPMFNTPSEYGDAMIDAGFNMVSLASNHSYDRGEVAVLNSLKYWETKDVMYTGIAASDEERTNYKIATKNDITYGFLSYTYGTNGITVPSDKKYLVNVYNDELAKQDIEAIRENVDVLIVAMHWGVEYQLEPNETQKKQAQYLADLGVDIVVGNHPHCLQPIEWIDDTLIIYSLGNFISNQIDLYSSIGYKGVIGAFATLDITKTTNKDQSFDIKLDNLNVELLYTYKNTTEKYYKVIPFSKINNTYLKNYQDVYEQYKNVILKYDQTINVLPAAS